MKIIDVKLGRTATGYRFHVRSSKEPMTLCQRPVFGSLDRHFLLDTKPEPLSVKLPDGTTLSVKLPDGTTYWGPQTEIKVDGRLVCTVCLSRLRRENR